MSRPRCPVCDQETNSYGRPFISEWAVATHIAGKIKYASSDRLHRAWAQRRVPEITRSLSLKRLAEMLLEDVHRELETSRVPNEMPTPLSLMLDTEVRLHQHIKHHLQTKYGVDDEAWWVHGVPLSIRQGCCARREEDPDRSEPYTYTDLIDLKSILEKSWSLFENDFRRVSKTISSRKEFLDLLVHLNEARRRHAHVRAPQPASKRYADDFKVASRVSEIMAEFCSSES